MRTATYPRPLRHYVTESRSHQMTKNSECETCAQLRHVSAWAIALIPRLCAFVLFAAGFGALAVAEWLSDAVDPPPRD